MSAAGRKVLVVGAGLSGLTAAAYLARAGRAVTLVERTKGLGGLLSSMEREGFTFDAGARSIENAGVLRPLLRDLGIDLELLKSPVSVGIGERLVHLDSRADLGAYRAMIEGLFPERPKETGRIFRDIDKVMREMEVIYGFENPVFRDFTKDRDYIFKELLPWLARFLVAVSRMNRMDEPIEDYLRRMTGSQSLNDLISQHFFKKTPMFFALGYFYVYLDYLYPRGGTGKLAEGLAGAVRRHGGEILMEAEVARLDLAGRRAALKDGPELPYEDLVWCADQKALYAAADPAGLPAATAARIAESRAAAEASRGGDSVFCLYLGVDRPPAEFAARTRGHLFYTPSAEGLGETHRSGLAGLLAGSGPLDRDRVLSWLRKYARLTTYEISIPSLRDPALSPPGKTGLAVSFLLEYDLVRRVKDEGWYEDFKRAAEESMLEVLEASIFPGLRERVVLRFSASPVTIAERFGSSEGGITGWTFERPSPAVHLLQKIPKAVETPMPGVLQAGQWSYSPAGIPTAILTGWYAFEALRKAEAKEKEKA